jgi:hypothetical protein
MGTEHDHVVITDRCIICRSVISQSVEKGDIITIINTHPLGGKYKVLRNKNGIVELEFING